MQNVIDDVSEEFKPSINDSDSLIDVDMIDSQLLNITTDRYGFRGGKQYTDPDRELRLPIQIVRSRELKWMKMCRTLTIWNEWRNKYRKKLRDRCRKGIPDSVRSKAWQFLVDSPLVTVEETQFYPTNLDEHNRNSSSRLNPSQSLPTVMTNTVSEGKHRKKSNAPISSPMPYMSSPTQSRKSFLTTKPYAGLTWRKFSSFMRLNHPSADKYFDQNNSLDWQNKVISDSPKDTAIDNYYRPGFDAKLPSAAYLGLPISDEATTNVPSNDVYSSTMSSNYFSAADSSSLHSFNALPDTSNANNMEDFTESPGVCSSAHMDFKTTCNGNLPFADSDAASSPGFSNFSMSTHSLASSTSPSLSHFEHSVATTNVDRDRTLVAPTNPRTLYAFYARQHGDVVSNIQIEKDIHRQFPFHELFCSKNSLGRESLYTLLKAYTIRHAGKGYCQGQAPLAAVLLMFMSETEAFWTFDQICERYLISYYDDGLELVQIDGEVLFALLKRIWPSIHKFLIKNAVQPIEVVLEWFMCVYTRTLPWASVLRVLDMFFCEGKLIIFKVGLILLHHCFGSVTFQKQCDGIGEIMMQLKEVPPSLDNCESLVKEIINLPLNSRQVAHEVSKQSQRWRLKMDAVVEGSNEK